MLHKDLSAILGTLDKTAILTITCTGPVEYKTGLDGIRLTDSIMSFKSGDHTRFVSMAHIISVVGLTARS